MNWLDAILGLLGGLVIFLFAMTRLSDALQEVAGQRMQGMLEKLTTNPITGLITGCIATTILDSSSLTIILVIALVNAGTLTFEQSLGVILGSNIGTTVSSLLYAIEIDRYAPILLLLGFVAALIWREKPAGQHGLVVFFLGLLLYGLHSMGEAMRPLTQSGSLDMWMKGLNNPIHGALFGAAATAVIQSSSAMMGITIKLATTGLMSLPAGVAVMLGAEIGTCLDTLVASVGRSRDAMRAGVFHFLFNCTTVCIGLILYERIAAIAAWLPGGEPSRQIANAHIFFNVTGALLFLPLIPLSSAALKWLIPTAVVGNAHKKAVQTS